MKIGISKIDLLDELEKAISINEFSVFIGAGLSKGAGYFDWKGLLKAPAMKLDLDVDEEHDLVSLAQYYCNQEGRPEINKLIRDTFPTSLPLNENYRLLSYLPIDTYWTTNYDILIEKSLRENSREPLVITEDKNMHLQSKKYDAVVYKMHGDVENPNNAVLTRDDYERYGITERVLFKDVLEGHLITNTFLFLGFSFTDPNFNFILGKLNALTDRNTRKHYCVIKKVLAEDFTKEVDGKRVLDEEKYKYNQIKQKLFIKDLKSRYKIETYLIESYDEITEVLSDLYCRYKKKTVFISGSADVYDPLDEQDAQRLISRLSYRMAEEGYHIVSGYGKGIGSYIIDGVTEYCYSKHNKKISDYLTLMPFPLNSVSNKDLKDTWSQYRDEIIQSAGIALFMFGNKLKDGELATADGMIEEFEISKKYKLDIIPLEYTGNASKQITELNGEKSNNFKTFKDVNSSVEEIIEKLAVMSRRT